jgi:N-methylhydantoinase B
MIGALAPVLPGKVPAAAAGELLVLAFGGKTASGNYVVGELIAGGSGGGPFGDGVDAIETDATNCMNLPAEVLEMEAPIRLHRVAPARRFRRCRRVARRPRRRSRIRGARR